MNVGLLLNWLLKMITNTPELIILTQIAEYLYKTMCFVGFKDGTGCLRCFVAKECSEFAAMSGLLYISR